MIAEILDATASPPPARRDTGRRRAQHPEKPAAETDDPVVVVSGDRDLLQLVGGSPVSVRVLYLGRGLSNATMFGPTGSPKCSVPVSPGGRSYAELAMLRESVRRTCRSVPGVGRRPPSLLREFGSLAFGSAGVMLIGQGEFAPS